jgi:Na+/H+-dicarboxylate symporter
MIYQPKGFYMNEKTKSTSLTTKIMLGLFLGAILGYVLRELQGAIDSDLIKNILSFVTIVANLFLSSLRMLVVPVIFISIVHGTLSLTDITTLGRVAGKTTLIYLFTTIIAVTLGISSALLIKPGANTGLQASNEYSIPSATSFQDIVSNLIPSNPIAAMVNGDTIQIIVFAIFIGIAISLTNVKKAEPVVRLFESLNAVIAKLVEFIMSFSHYGIFFITAKIFTTISATAVGSLLMYILLTYVVMLIHMFITYSCILKFWANISPIKFFSKIKDVILFSFSTASSNATIPISMNAVTKRCGVSSKIASFTIPLGSTVNMDGTSIMQGIATIFIAQAYNLPLGVNDYIVVILTATLASIGTAGVPSAGVIMLAMVLQKVGLPMEGIALIVGVDRLIDMLRTSVNVAGDCVTACVVAKSEGELDIDVFNKQHDDADNLDLHHMHAQDK